MWPFKKEKDLILSRFEILDLLPPAQYYQVLDRSYILPSNDQVLSTLGKDWSSYLAEYNDCDDYAFRAKGKVAGRGWPFAVTWINSSHYINMFINRQKEVIFIEPQSRSFYELKIITINSIIM